MQLYVGVSGSKRADPELNKELDFNSVLNWWGKWQVEDWFQRDQAEKATLMPPNTRTLGT